MEGRRLEPKRISDTLPCVKWDCESDLPACYNDGNGSMFCIKCAVGRKHNRGGPLEYNAMWDPAAPEYNNARTK